MTMSSHGKTTLRIKWDKGSEGEEIEASHVETNENNKLHVTRPFLIKMTMKI